MKKNELFPHELEQLKIVALESKESSDALFLNNLFFSFSNKDGCQWSMDANAFVQGIMDNYPSIQAQIVGYTDQGVAEILLFVTIAPQVSVPTSAADATMGTIKSNSKRILI